MRGGRGGGIGSALVIGAVTMALAGCAESSIRGAPLPEGPPVVTVRMREYRFEYPRFVPSGRVIFRFVNDGRRLHQPDMLPLADSIPPIDEQLRGKVRQALTQFAGIPPRRPGQVGSYAVDLAPGQRYALICFAVGADGESHALKGMNAEFRAGQRRPPG